MGSAITFPVPPTPPALDEQGLRELVREAIRRTYNQMAFAIDCDGVHPSQVSRWLSGVERFPLTHLAKAPAVQRQFARLLAEATGFHVRAVNAREERRREIEQLQHRLSALIAEEMREAA